MKITQIKMTTLNPVSQKGFLVIVLLELFLGGGGRLIDVGPLSLRMYFFILAIFMSAIILLEDRPVSKNFFYVLLSFTVLLIVSASIGFLNGASANMILNDIKPLLFIYFLIFFYLTIRTEEDVQMVVKVIKFSAILLAVLYISTFVLINTGLVSFREFYGAVSSSEEFFFRGEFAFFYKGFIYMCVGLFFFLTEEKINKTVVIILTLAVILTFTRGFIVSIVLTYLTYLAFIRKSGFKVLLFSVVIAVGSAFLWSYFYATDLNRAGSDSARVAQIRESIEMITPASLLIGHGFGIGVPSRPERMEIAYLEIFHKQGLFGLLFWFSLFIFGLMLYGSAKNRNVRMAAPFLLSVMLIYIQSISNPFINNPIGLTMILLSLVCMRIIGRKEIPDEN